MRFWPFSSDRPLRGIFYEPKKFYNLYTAGKIYDLVHIYIYIIYISHGQETIR